MSKHALEAGEEKVRGDVLEAVDPPTDGLGVLIALLEKAQIKHGYLPEEALRTIAKETGRSLVDVYGVATFYKSFSLKPRGKHKICACSGTACHVRGGERIVQEFERRLGVKAGETTEDKEFSLETVNCLGACALGPVVVVDGRYVSKMKTSRVKHLLDQAAGGYDEAESGKGEKPFQLSVSCPRCNHTLMDKETPIDGYPSVRVTISHNRMHGSLRLSSLYGSWKFLSEHEIATDSVVVFLCPHCHRELNDASQCNACGASMVPMIIQGGGTVLICPRRGCNSHRLEIL